ncbi:hypothetical protein BsWGS_17285 [Bradybaena similaris]
MGRGVEHHGRKTWRQWRSKGVAEGDSLPWATFLFSFFVVGNTFIFFFRGWETFFLCWGRKRQQTQGLPGVAKPLAVPLLEGSMCTLRKWILACAMESMYCTEILLGRRMEYLWRYPCAMSMS